MMKFVIFCVAAISLSAVASFNIRETTLLPEGRISRGRNATEGQFPYMVYLFIKSDPESETGDICGGSLIGNEWILTAAHCTIDKKEVTVLLGSTDIRYPEVQHIVSSQNIIVYPGYNLAAVNNDIALIKIPFTNYTRKIYPVRLPSFANINTTYSGVPTVMSGWGITSNDMNSKTNLLKWAKFYTIENSLCAIAYKKHITASKICIATGMGISSCVGDSGGPLVSISTGTQIGINSFGSIFGCHSGQPVAFTRITSYLEWIKQHTGIYY